MPYGPYRHVKVLDKEGAHKLTQLYPGWRKEKPAAKFEIMCLMLMIDIMNIIAIKDII
jgi:hypothetical protein